MTVVERLDAFQRRHEWAGYPIAVVYKYIDDQGGNLAALIAYYAFLSLFPLLLLLTTTLGLVLFAGLVAYVALTHSDEEGAHAAHDAGRDLDSEPLPALELD